MGASNAYDVIKSKIDEFGSYGLLINFSIGELTFSTTSETGYLMSLEHVKSGCGHANSFTLGLAYCPDPEGITGLDSNLIDFGILLASEDVEFDYGYVFSDGTVVKTPKYTGRILDYSIQIQNSMILYTITGYSNISALKDNKCTKDSKELKELAGGTSNPVKLVIGLLNELIAENNLKYTVVDETTEYPCADNEEFFADWEADQYIFEFCRTVLATARWVEQAKKVDNGTIEDPNELITYDFIIEDTKEGSKIRIVAINPDEKGKSADTIDYTFDWMSGRNSDIVLDFKPEFSGAVAIAQASKIYNDLVAKTTSVAGDAADGKDDTKKYALDNDGKIMEVLNSLYTDTFAGTAGSSSNNDMLAAIGMNAFYEQNIYNATLTTLGITDDIKILTHCIVTPLIYGQKHHTAGEYFITKMTDNVNTAGFQTTMELFKVGASKEYKKKLLGKYLEDTKDQLLNKYGNKKGNSMFKNMLNNLRLN